MYGSQQSVEYRGHYVTGNRLLRLMTLHCPNEVKFMVKEPGAWWHHFDREAYNRSKSDQEPAAKRACK